MRRMLLANLCMAALLSPRAAAAQDARTAAPILRAGAIELGLSGALTSVESATRATALVRAARFSRMGAGLVALEGEVGYSHVSSLDALELEAAVSWQRRARDTSCYPYVALAAGTREEWIGSFRDARLPVGLTLGVRMLAGERAAARVEYRVRRVLHDPVADFTEQQVLVGLSLLFHNAQRGHA